MITAPIPLPQSGADAFGSGMTTSQSIINSLMQNKLIPSQIQEAQGKAAQSQMMAQLIQGAMKGGTGGANNGMLLSGLLGIPTQTQVIDGQLVQTNPVSGTSSQQIGQTPEQKSATAVQQANDISTNASNTEQTKALSDAADEAVDNLASFKKVNDMITENPDLTGNISGKAAKYGYEYQPRLGEFVGVTKRIQGQAAKALGQRGGISVYNAAAGMKPDAGNQGDYNLSLTKGGFNETMNSLKTMNDHYRQANNGRDMPQYIKAMEMYGNDVKDGGWAAMPSSNTSAQVNNSAPASNQGETISPAAKALSKTITMPKFNSQKEAKDWFAKQPIFVQQAIRLKLKDGQ